MKLLLLTLAALLLLSQLTPGNLVLFRGGGGVESETWSRNPTGRGDEIAFTTQSAVSCDRGDLGSWGAHGRDQPWLRAKRVLPEGYS